MSRNIRSMSSRLELQNSLFERLNEAARKSGAPTSQDLREIAADSFLTPGVMGGAASFYDYLQEDNKGCKTWTCKGTSCLVSGTIAKPGEQAGDALCVGYCYKGGGVLKRDASGTFSSHHVNVEGSFQPAMPEYCYSDTAILTGAVEQIENLYRAGLQETAVLIKQLKASKLRGRGGAGFPFALKLEACCNEKQQQKYIVCNADEGDPGAFSDRYLLERQPHKVLAGLFAAAVIAGADKAVLYIRREYPEAIAFVEAAIKQYEKLPTKISERVVFHIIEGAGSYVCGEETALLNSIEGLRPEVRTRPPFPASYGLWGKPTVVSNVETFANIPWILQQGGAAFAAIGTKASKGTKLISLDNQFTRPGLYEVDFGTSFDQLIFEMAGGFKGNCKALQVGGPLGSIVPIDKISELKISFEDFAHAGFALGHAGIIAIPTSFPMIDLLRHLFSYMAHESCGKCTPCRIGTAKGAALLQSASPDNPLDHALMSDLLDLLETASLCALGGGLPLPVRNCLEHFRPELAEFFSNWEAGS